MTVKVEDRLRLARRRANWRTGLTSVMAVVCVVVIPMAGSSEGDVNFLQLILAMLLIGAVVDVRLCWAIVRVYEAIRDEGISREALDPDRNGSAGST